MELKFKLYNLKNTRYFAQALSALVCKGEVLLLKGNLGSGKTTLSRFFIESLVSGAKVSSPTFGIVSMYEGKSHCIWHYDLYRVKHQEELYELGFEESLKDGITIIEWPELVEKSISNDRIVVYLRREYNSDVRMVEISLFGAFNKKRKKIEQLVAKINESTKE